MEEYMKIIDAHTHLWLRQCAEVNDKPIYGMPDGRAMFMGEEVQMLPPFITDGRNTAEILLSNMNYARVSAAVVTQEFIDGLQNDYLLDVVRRYPDRFFVFGMADYRCPGWPEQIKKLVDDGFRGIKIPAARLIGTDWRVRLDSDEMMQMMHLLETHDMLLHVELADGDIQVPEIEHIIHECPRLRIIIGHFGMVTRPHWMDQIRLARYENVYIECGGITWLFNDEFWPFPSAVRAIREAADEVGISHLMWGSDYPRTITAITYKMSYDFILKSKLLSWEEKCAFLSGNAQRVFGFDHLIDLPYIKNMSE
jgi:predicted TIM-barrel fold metal-dependent hydrolase